MIDRQTVEKIKDAANIVDVVSEFVTLKRSGSGYKGLCPFHNEKTPSFIVSPARGTCHCFGCGKGGTPVSFIMEHEQLTYPEALRWLAKKYNIEIHERELTDAEREEQSRRESMFIVNEWAQGYFENLLHHHQDGQAIGMQYLRSRGFRDDVIRTFRLGYDLPDRFLLGSAALAKGYKPEYLTATGLCYKTDRGELIDRFAGRVVFPWIGVSGKVVGFTARVLDKRTKGVNQKYVNSPDSDIYHKDHELYGIWQAKRAIAKEDRVYMVEGQADVIAMHQCGIENVVANSGTALSTHQIHTLHRFTSNITLIYDGDAAGIHAAMRGTDMLLADGMSLRVLLLPDGQDPDEFARNHTPEELRRFIDERQADFIQFKTDLLLRGERDPKKRADAINSIVQSISVIPNQILRDTYIHDCAQRVGMSESTLINQMNVFIRQRRTVAQPERNGQPAGPQPQPSAAAVEEDAPGVEPAAVEDAATETASYPQAHYGSGKIDEMLLRLVVRYGERIVYQEQSADGEAYGVTLAQFVAMNLEADSLTMRSPLYNRMLREAAEKSSAPGFSAAAYFLHHDDIEVSRVASRLVEDQYHVTERKDGTPLNEEDRLQKEANEQEELRQQMEHVLLDFRFDYVETCLKDLRAQMAGAMKDKDRLREIMARYNDMSKMRMLLSKKLGKDIIV